MILKISALLGWLLCIYGMAIIIKMRADKMPFLCAAGWHADTRDVVKFVITPRCTRTFVRCTCKRCGRVDVEEPWIR